MKNPLHATIGSVLQQAKLRVSKTPTFHWDHKKGRFLLELGLGALKHKPPHGSFHNAVDRYWVSVVTRGILHTPVLLPGSGDTPVRSKATGQLERRAFHSSSVTD